MLGTKFVKCLMSIMNWQFNSSSSLASFFIAMTCKFSAHIFSTLNKRIPPKFQFLDFRICSGENLLNFSCHFWKGKSVFLQMFHQYSVLPKITHLHFLTSKIIYFVQKKPIKMIIFQIFKCSGPNSSNSSCQYWAGKSIPVQIWYKLSFSCHKSPL